MYVIYWNYMYNIYYDEVIILPVTRSLAPFSRLPVFSETHIPLSGSYTEMAPAHIPLLKSVMILVTAGGAKLWRPVT